MSPVRLNREAVRARLADVPAWILETLMDAFEPAALTALAAAQNKNRKKPDGNADGTSRPESSDD